MTAEKEVEDIKPSTSNTREKAGDQAEGSNAAGKRKANNVVVVIDDGEEDVKPFKKKTRSGAESSKEKAIDLTDLCSFSALSLRSCHLFPLRLLLILILTFILL